MFMRLRSRWWVVVASVAGLLVGNGPVMQFTFGTMLPPVSREFGWSRGMVSPSIVIGLWMTGLATPLIGRLVDRFGIRAVALPAIIVFSAATASVALVPASRAAFIGLYALMGLAAAGQTPFLLAFPAVAFVVGRQPGDTRARQATAAALPGLTAVEAARTARFWLLAISFFLVAGTTGGVISHLVPLLTDRGLPVQSATALLSISGLALIGGRVLAGSLLDRIHAPYVAAGFFTASLVGTAVMALTSRQNPAALGAVLIGIGLGAEVDLIAFLLSRYLGMRSFGEIYGYLFAIFMLGAEAGPFLMGVSFDMTGSYKPMLVCSAFLLLLASVLMLCLGAYAYPQRQTEGLEEVARAAC